MFCQNTLSQKINGMSDSYESLNHNNGDDDDDDVYCFRSFASTDRRS